MAQSDGSHPVHDSSQTGEGKAGWYLALSAASDVGILYKSKKFSRPLFVAIIFVNLTLR
jgi:hypothetical protein